MLKKLLGTLLFVAFTSQSVLAFDISHLEKTIDSQKIDEYVRDKNLAGFIKQNAKEADFDSQGNIISLSFLNKGLTTLPPELGSLPKLSHLDLRSNRLSSLPKEIWTSVGVKVAQNK